ncbi:nuclear transport factor 2 family protein [Streptomyces akebiae]|uniref:Nuclear transport factor 2 family protein n=1 Tax=Streptomyces akebiae TaxID=2865673 RepID=A0ABX8XLK7_9ACTN|nr:nuclear transport factor 2 family protein [Streptomyces akebiae]QYX76644.1 nuclear transport factor 2 family protein [Streptomyces akebiae]
MTDLQTLLDEREITQTLSRLTRILDKRDWDSLDTVFAEDLTFNYGLGERAGTKELRENLSGFLANCGPTMHLLGSPLVEADGDTARTEVYGLARHQGAGERGHLYFDTAGVWIDQWERRADGWRIVRRDIAPLVMQGDPAALGSDALPETVSK